MLGAYLPALRRAVVVIYEDIGGGHKATGPWYQSDAYTMQAPAVDSFYVLHSTLDSDNDHAEWNQRSIRGPVLRSSSL